MIARTAHARSFSHLALYLESDKADPAVSRAAWWSPHNLPSSSIRSAARWMERTAERNRLVERPAYHLFVAVAPQDDAGPARMRVVGERLLRRLELHGHQAVAVGHEDRRHPHLHLAVNRVHPVTLRAWNPTRDWPRIERALREIEREMGFRPTPGRLAPTPDGRWCDNARAMPVGARRFELRELEKARRAAVEGTTYTARPSFLRYARERFAPDVMAATGWDDLEAAATRRGLALLQTGRGLVVTDGTHGAAISRVASGASLNRLTRDFGEDYVGFLARTRGFGRDAAAAGAVRAGEPTAPGTATRSAAGARAGSRAAEPARAPGAAAAPQPEGLRGRGAPEHPARTGRGDGNLGSDRGHPHAPDPGRGHAPLGGEHADHGGDAGGGASGRGDRRLADRAAAGVDAGAAGDGGGADDRAPGRGQGTGGDAGREHAGGGEQHRHGAARAVALRGGAQAPDLPPRSPARGRDGDPGPAPGAPPVPVLGDAAAGRGGVEPGDGAHPHVPLRLTPGAGGDPAHAGLEEHAGRGAGAPFHVERAPGGWAVVHAPSSRRWTLAREETARRFGGAGGSLTPAGLERAFRRLDRETARESHRDLVARTAAGELLDQAAVHCFADPVAATDVVRWNHLRRQAGHVRGSLAAGPAAFGALRVERDAPEVWASLPEPRHAHVPAWARFRAAAEVWLDVHDGRPWTPPAQFPPPPDAPAPYPGGARGAAPRPAPMPAARPPVPDDTVPLPRARSPGLSR